MTAGAESASLQAIAFTVLPEMSAKQFDVGCEHTSPFSYLCAGCPAPGSQPLLRIVKSWFKGVCMLASIVLGKDFGYAVVMVQWS